MLKIFLYLFAYIFCVSLCYNSDMFLSQLQKPFSQNENNLEESMASDKKRKNSQIVYNKRESEERDSQNLLRTKICDGRRRRSTVAIYKKTK